ncbi:MULTISPECIES: hypothetical protein [Sphingomonas]|uniref:hypothetical protein n=1 Tax=Sphingomonas TaxID=13687 RepID=UPI000833F692|nr:hypothetical protein [Sphingomonas sp. CCH10-B3]
MLSVIFALALAAQTTPVADAAAHEALVAEARQVERDFVPRNLATIDRTRARLLELSRRAARIGDRPLANELKVKAAYVQLIAGGADWVRFALLDVIKDAQTSPAIRNAARNMLVYVNRPLARDTRQGDTPTPTAQNFGFPYTNNGFPEPTFPSVTR